MARLERLNCTDGVNNCSKLNNRSDDNIKERDCQTIYDICLNLAKRYLNISNRAIGSPVQLVTASSTLENRYKQTKKEYNRMESSPMLFLATLPILAFLILLLLCHWSTARAGLLAWLTALAVGWLSFGLTPQVFWISQAKGLLLALFVLAIFWPALFLYYLIHAAGGIRALGQALEMGIGERSLLTLILAWAFSGVLEGLAGFGIPIAIVAPLLVGLGVEPVLAVAAVAVGHAWSVTFGDMGVIFQTLLSVVQMSPSEIVPTASSLLGVACILCGLGTAFLLGQLRRWPVVLVLGAFMAGVQFLLANAGLTQLAGFGAGLAGVCGGMLYGSLRKHPLSRSDKPAGRLGDKSHLRIYSNEPTRDGITSALYGYGGLVALMLIVTLPGPIQRALYPVLWQIPFPAVTTSQGFVTSASLGPAFRVFLHPGTAITVMAALFAWGLSRRSARGPSLVSAAFHSTLRAGLPASLGILATLGLSAMMDHTGMTLRLAKGLSQLVGQAFPLVSPWIGILGAFASGSNNNSNVLFGMLQKNAALLLDLAPSLLVAAQTTGGALGSMIAPAKIVVGCSTAGIQGKEGDVLRKSLPWGLGIGVMIGILALGMMVLHTNH
jgi:lactate permease